MRPLQAGRIPLPLALPGLPLGSANTVGRGRLAIESTADPDVALADRFGPAWSLAADTTELQPRTVREHEHGSRRRRRLRACDRRPNPDCRDQRASAVAANRSPLAEAPQPGLWPQAGAEPSTETQIRIIL
jgi:hypothetical protein